MIRTFLHPILWPLVFLGISASAYVGTCNNNEPVIGIVSQALSDYSSIVKHYPWAKGKSYIAASYVKFIESSGMYFYLIKSANIYCCHLSSPLQVRMGRLFVKIDKKLKET